MRLVLCMAVLFVVPQVLLADESVPLAVLASSDGELAPKDAARLQQEVVEAAAALARHRVVVTAQRVLPVGTTAARAVAVGKEAGARQLVTVDAAELGDGAVIYLQAVEVPSGRALGSTTAPIGSVSEVAADRHRAVLRAALVRLLEPTRYQGTLALHVDTDGAAVEVDGRVVDAAAPVLLPVGTHALRVTHPRYHDYLRFVDIEFERSITLDVPLAAYPLAEGEMAAELQKAPAVKKRRPWYGSPWLWAGAAVLVAGATLGIVYGVRGGLEFDRGLIYRAPSGP